MSAVIGAGGHSLPPDLTTGSVVLDIGGETGALVIHTDATRLGDEIEVTRLEDAGWRTHVAVLKRRVPRGEAYAAVFSALREGDYRILGAAAPNVASARVTAGGVDRGRLAAAVITHCAHRVSGLQTAPRPQ